MTKGGSNYMKIKIKTETGEVVKITDENNKKATQITPAELEQMYQSQAGVKHVATILYTHASPG